MKAPETVSQELVRQHLCGFPVRIHIELEGFKVTQTKLTEAQVSISGANVRYYRLNDNEPLTDCPRCGKAFPKAVN
jgi:hypothetical protein